MLRSAIAAAAMIFALPVAAEPVRFAVTDIEGLEALQQEFSAFEKALEDTTGLDIELFPVSSRTSAVESMNQSKVDLVLTGPAEYVVMKELTNAEIVIVIYAGTKGYLDDIPVREVGRWEEGLISFLRNGFPRSPWG